MSLMKVPEYIVWQSIRQRCLNKNHAAYPKYGGAGIKICPQWMKSYNKFLDDMGPRPTGTSIDRMDNSKGYSPENCRWATATEQLRNRRWAKLNKELALLIHELHNSGLGKHEIANKTGVSHPNVSAALAGRSWADVLFEFTERELKARGYKFDQSMITPEVLANWKASRQLSVGISLVNYIENLSCILR